MEKNVTKINRDYELLAPFFAQKLRSALAECHEQGYPVELFEGMRSGDRQDWLYSSGRTRDGKIITHARAGESAHNVGLAADVVFFINGKWDWSGQYDKVEQIMISHGFSSLKFERCHFQITGGLTAKKAWEMARQHGLLHLWSVVESSLKDE